jgi:hypothetical protein
VLAQASPNATDAGRQPTLDLLDRHLPPDKYADDRPVSASEARELIGWIPDLPEDFVEASDLACALPEVGAERSFYHRFAESGLATRLPVEAARLLRHVLGGENRSHSGPAPTQSALRSASTSRGLRRRTCAPSVTNCCGLDADARPTYPPSLDAMNWLAADRTGARITPRPHVGRPPCSRRLHSPALA